MSQLWGRYRRWVLNAMALVAGVGVLVGFFLVYGDPAGSRGEVGVRTDGDHIVFRVRACDDPYAAYDVALRRVSDDALVWRLVSSQGSNQIDFVLGQSAPGFNLIQGLEKPLDPDGSYVVVIDIGLPNRLSTEFKPRDLTTSRWELSANKRVSVDKFDLLEPC